MALGLRLNTATRDVRAATSTFRMGPKPWLRFVRCSALTVGPRPVGQATRARADAAGRKVAYEYETGGVLVRNLGKIVLCRFASTLNRLRRARAAERRRGPESRLHAFAKPGWATSRVTTSSGQGCTYREAAALGTRRPGPRRCPWPAPRGDRGSDRCRRRGRPIRSRRRLEPHV